MEGVGIEPEKLSFLEHEGAGTIGHSKRTLLQHLVGVRALLASWRARPELLDAGLFHSIYGTEFFLPVLVDPTQRDRVQALIGAEAERLANLWAGLQRSSLAENVGRSDGFRARRRGGVEGLELTLQDVQDLVTLWTADTLEQVDRLGGRTRHQPELFALRAFALKPARLALERVFADRPFAKTN
jgi:hypothetical protein